MGKGSGKDWDARAASWTPQHGKGAMALPALAPAAEAEYGGIPLWKTKGWIEPGDWAEGRVSVYREQPSPTAKSAAGWIRMCDDGPDVYFRPQHLDSTLCELLRQGRIQHTRVSVKVYYRPNGRDRFTREVHYLEEEDDVQGGVRRRGGGS